MMMVKDLDAFRFISGICFFFLITQIFIGFDFEDTVEPR